MVIKRGRVLRFVVGTALLGSAAGCDDVPDHTINEMQPEPELTINEVEPEPEEETVNEPEPEIEPAPNPAAPEEAAPEEAAPEEAAPEGEAPEGAAMDAQSMGSGTQIAPTRTHNPPPQPAPSSVQDEL